MHAAAIAGSQQAQDRVHAAMELLDRGEEARARSLLERALRQEPGNATARRLRDEIDVDPRRQLGERSYAYIVRDADTMTSLAERFLGDPLLFYALARYNDIIPNQLASGQTIRIPDRGRAIITASAHAPAPSATGATSAVPPPAVGDEAAARANRLRLQGLERLNSGDADTAVVLLRQARALDATNAAIQADLNRAQRIQASLRTQ